MSSIARRTNPTSSRSLSSRSGDYREFTFQFLRYPTIKISDEKRVATKFPTESSGKPIVYFNRELRTPPDKLILRVERSNIPPPLTTGAHSFVIGFTTCDSAKVYQHTRHFTDYCRSEYECGGKSLWIKILSADFVGTHIMLERIRPGMHLEDSAAFVKITIVHGQNTRSFNMIDPDNLVFQAGTRPCHPFIIFGGSVISMKVVKEIESSPPVNPVLGRAVPARLANSMSDLFPPESWIHSNLIRVEQECIERSEEYSPSELYYAFSSSAFEMNWTLTFFVSEVDSEIGGSISFGVTTCQPENIILDCLPTDPSDLLTSRYNKNWTVALDILSDQSLTPGKYFSIKRTVGGFTLKLAPKNIRTLLYFDPEKKVYPFFHFNGSVKMINVVSAPVLAASSLTSTFALARRVPSPSRSPSVASDTSDYGGKCVICLEEAADHMCIPCFHVAFCEGCAHTIKMGMGTPQGFRHCPVCRKRLEDIKKIFLP